MIEVWVEHHNYERILGFLAAFSMRGDSQFRDEAFRIMLTTGGYKVADIEALDQERNRRVSILRAS